MSTSNDTPTTSVLPSLPEHPVDAPSKCPSGPIYQVPQDHEPTEGWWAKRTPYGVEILEGPFKRGFLYFEIPQGRLDTFLQVGLELRVPYITLWDLVQVLSWSVVPTDDDIHSWMNSVVRRIENHGSRFAYSNQKKELFCMTRKVFAERLDRCDVRGAAQEAVLKETAHLRHSARVQATVDVALDHVREMIPTIGPMKDQDVRLVAATLILADIMGIGGTDGVKGDSTHRMPPFNQLGKGRKHASDGPAYMAAAESAFHQIFEGISQVHFSIEATPKTLVARVDGWDDAVLIDSDIVPLRRLRTIAREGLRRSLGMSAWFDDLPYEVRFPGYSEDWAAAVNRIEAEIEVDSLTVDAEVFSVTDRGDEYVVVRIKTSQWECGEPVMVSVRFVRNASGELALDDDWFESSYKRLGVYYDRLVRLYTDLANGRHQEPTKAEEQKGCSHHQYQRCLAKRSW